MKTFLQVLQYGQALLFAGGGGVSIWLAFKVHTLGIGVVGLALLAVGVFFAYATYKKHHA